MIIIAEKSGQLGNRLFLFGHLIALSIEQQIPIANPSFAEYAEYFEKTAQDLFCRYPFRVSLIRPSHFLRKWIYSGAFHTANQAAKLNRKRNSVQVYRLPFTETLNLRDQNFLSIARETKVLMIQGWCFRDNENFQKHCGEIKKYFKPIDHLLRNIEVLIDRAREGTEILLGVHIRHRDYKEFMNGKYFYDLDTYKAVMLRALELFGSKKIKFLICSDTVFDPAAFSSFPCVFGTNHMVEDLYSFARCDYLIGPPSTYTAWASFYGDVPLYQIEDPKRVMSDKDFTVQRY